MTHERFSKIGANNPTMSTSIPATTTTPVVTNGDGSTNTVVDNSMNIQTSQQTAQTTTLKPYIEPLNIGDTCNVTWRDGTTQLLAKIVELKRLPNAKGLVKTLPPPSSVVDKSSSSLGGVDGGEEEPALKRIKPNDDDDDATKAAADEKDEGQLKSPPELLQQPSSTNNKQEEEESQQQKLSAYDLLYYIHYEEHDRRLDEWVPISRFDLGTLQRVSSPDANNAHGGHGGGGSNDELSLLGSDVIDWQGTRRSSTRRGGAEGNKSRGRGRRSSSNNNALTLINDGGTESTTNTNTNNNNNNSSDTLLRGGNWHGNSGNPDLAELEAEHHEITKVKNIGQIVMGKYLVEAWYYSPFPPPYHEIDTLYICEFCLKYMRKPSYFMKHCCNECTRKCPPGTEIYREKNLSVYELDGKDHRVYCQNLCLLAKLFLDHKTLYYDVDPFYFYVITEVDDDGAHIVGYFSKEKVSAEDYNLACILTFPQYQKCGYGKFIISLSYELSKREGKPGSPEKPLSDLGKISYRSYWTHVLLTLFSEQSGEENIQIKDISLMTGIKTEDIISTLQSLNMIRFWKGQHVVFVMQDFLKKYAASLKKKKNTIRLCDGKCLTWIPHAERKKGVGGGGGGGGGD